MLYQYREEFLYLINKHRQVKNELMDHLDLKQELNNKFLYKHPLEHDNKNNKYGLKLHVLLDDSCLMQLLNNELLF